MEEAVVEVLENKTKKTIKMSPRPCIRRRVRGRPQSHYFKPAGVPMSTLEESILSKDEFEAIRLIDSENLPQEQAAKQMKVSQPTLSRILTSARKKIAEAITKGKAIKIEK